MNAERFMELMNTLPDDMIVTAVHAEYRRRPKLIRFLPAVAACLVIGIFAAVYPKLRIQTPGITEPPAATVTTGTTITTAELSDHSETQPSTAPIRQTVSSVTVAGNTTASVTVPAAETDAPAATELPETNTHTETIPPVITTELTDATNLVSDTESEATHTVVQVIKAVQIWKGVDMRPELASDPMSEPQIRCRFWLSEPDMDMIDGIRNQYGIPAEFDLIQKQCLLIQLETEYADTAVTGGTLTTDGLLLYVACRNQKEPLTDMYFAVPLPEGITVDPENCRAEYQIYEDESGKPKTKNPLIEIYE